MRVRAIADYHPEDSMHLSFSFGETLTLHLDTGGTDATYLKATTQGGEGSKGGKRSGLVPAAGAGLVAMEGPRAHMVIAFVAEHKGERASRISNHVHTLLVVAPFSSTLLTARRRTLLLLCSSLCALQSPRTSPTGSTSSTALRVT